MPELFLHISVSLDGYIEDADGDIEWMTSDTSFDDYSTALLQSIEGMVFGRKAHELLAGFWPTAADRVDATPALVAQAQLMNTLPKYVLTHGPERTGWTNSHVVSPREVRRLKSTTTRPLAAFAGAGAAQALLAEGLIDELRLVQYPLLLGGGTPLFPAGPERRSLTHVVGQRFPSGAVLQTYRVDS